MKKVLSIIIVNYNTKKLVLDCVSSIKKYRPKASYEIIVVENSTEPPLDPSSDFKLIVNKNNSGFAKANNQGIRAAKGKYILLLNSDTEVKKGSLDKLIDFAEKHPEAGAIAPKLLNADGSVQPSVFKLPTLFNAIREYWFGEKGKFSKYSIEGDRVQKVESPVMAAFLITPLALKKVGRLNEKYFMYFEDMDYMRRLKRARLPIYYVPEAEIIHYHGQSGKKIANQENQWRRLIPSSKIYHGNVKHYLLQYVLWLGQKFGKYIPPALLIIFTIPAFFNLLRSGYFPMQDDLQAFRVYEMDKCFTDFQIPCRWVPDAGYGFGYPQFNYYPPLPYYIGALMHRVGIQYIDSVKILFIAGYILSALAIYVLVNSLIKSRWAGFVSALLYTYIPYKAVEVYVRGALSEFWAQIFFPLILWASYKLIKTGKTKYLVWFSLSTFFLATTHSLMTMIFLPVAVIWASYFFYIEKWKNLGKIITGGVIGVLLSSFFVLPVAFERQFVHIESVLSGYFDYRQHFVSLYKLFVSREWGYGSSGFPNEKLNLSLGIVQWILGLVTAGLAVINLKKRKSKSILVIILSLLTLFSIFMIHIKSSFIWAKLPFLWYLQFPWRFLALSIFLLSLLTGFFIYYSGKYKYILGILMIVIAIAVNISFFVPKDWLNITDKEKFSGVSWDKQLTISIFDYLPIYGELPPWSKAEDLPEVLKGSVNFLNYDKGSDYQMGMVEVKEDSIVRVPLFDFPGMEVKVDGQKIDHVNNNCTGERYCRGLITFNLPQGNHFIEIRLKNTPIRTAGNLLTILGAGSLVFLMIKSRRRN